MARPKVYGDRVTTAIRVPAELHERLQQVADARGLSVNTLLVKAATFYLETVMRRVIEEEDQAEARVAG